MYALHILDSLILSLFPSPYRIFLPSLLCPFCCSPDSYSTMHLPPSLSLPLPPPSLPLPPSLPPSLSLFLSFPRTAPLSARLHVPDHDGAVHAEARRQQLLSPSPSLPLSLSLSPSLSQIIQQ